MGSSALLLFGATGDLARRMLLPSLYALYDDGLLPKDLRLVGTARSALDDQGYRDLAEEALGCLLVPLGAEQKVDRLAGAVDGAVEVTPLPIDPDVGLVDVPRSAARRRRCRCTRFSSSGAKRWTQRYMVV